MTIQTKTMKASELSKGDVIELIHPLDNKPILCTICELEVHECDVVVTFEGVWNGGFSGIHDLQVDQKVKAIPMQTLINQKLG
ncbi:hypothetical protein [Bacillus bombysepticus]|uniref:hypothetical protein n=1 Tax=Bacillus bombysepticus TaxID=658666 RepID=UPI0030164BBC